MAGEWLREPRTPVDDQDRELVVGLLLDAAQTGVLPAGEYQARLKRAKTARIIGELAPLVVDLDGAPSAVREPNSQVVYVPVTRDPAPPASTAAAAAAVVASGTGTGRPVRTPAEEWSASLAALIWSFLLLLGILTLVILGG